MTDSNPANNANNVDRNANLRVTFTEPVNVSDAAFSLTCGGAAIAVIDTRQSDTVSVLDPAQTLPVGASCTLRVEGDLYNDTDTNDPDDTGSDYSAKFTTSGVEGLRIHDIQGRQHLSPYRNSIVAGVPGVVTATRFNGFYVQDPQPDRDTRTSEGIFVFTGSLRPGRGRGRRRGQGLRARHRVPPGLHADLRGARLPGRQLRLVLLPQPHVTEIDRATVTAGGTGTIKPTIVGRGGREIPDTVIDDDTPDPERDDPPLITGDVESSRAPRRHRQPGPDVRPVGGRHRLLRVARGHAHADQQGRRGRADERLQRRAPRTRTPSWPCSPTAARTRARSRTAA